MLRSPSCFHATLAALWLALSASAVMAQEWVADGDDGQLQFFVTYEGTEAPGWFGAFDVWLRMTPDERCLEVTVETASIDLDADELNEEVVKPEWFAVETHPEARFFSDDLRADGEGGFIAHGSLNLKGIEQPLEVPFRWQTDPARLQGEVMINRTAFDIGMGEWADGDTIARPVRLSFDLQPRPHAGDEADHSE